MPVNPDMLAPEGVEHYILVTDPEGITHRILAEPGWRIMELLRDAGLMKEGCGGQCLCATCHIYIAPLDRDKTGTRSEDEDLMLDEIEAKDESTSRLSCQILYNPELVGLRLTIGPTQ